MPPKIPDSTKSTLKQQTRKEPLNNEAPHDELKSKAIFETAATNLEQLYEDLQNEETKTLKTQKVKKLFNLFFIFFGAITVALFSFISDPKSFFMIKERFFTTDPRLLYSVAISATAAGIFFALTNYLTPSKNTDSSFQDIDKERKKKNSSLPIPEFLKPSSAIISQQDENSKKEKQSTEAIFEEKLKYCETQQHIFVKINDELKEQVELFDEKASKMLDQGLERAKFGVTFLIGSIIVWQFIFLFKEPDSRHYVGIASCSLIFVFMQALAAWCLKQHRAYVDASLYVTKIRSIFERKMQAYLLVKEYEECRDGYHKLLDNFLTEIEWPPEPLSAKQQTSYAKEAAETLTEVTKSLKVLHTAYEQPARPSRRHSSPHSRN